MSHKIKAYGVCLYKKTSHNIQILLCKSVQSQERWGFLKGCAIDGETKEETAIREFFEESSIFVEEDDLEQYFEQENELKDIGIYLVNSSKIKNLDKCFANNKLHHHCLSWENSKVEFFNINTIPKIKKKQYKIMDKVIDYLTRKN
ncbi:MAG: NUDIX domain-containing protein [Campylobacterota bacterium]|nr:NUDIX domain-containing protein [Campylobacterota bacterium]